MLGTELPDKARKESQGVGAANLHPGPRTVAQVTAGGGLAHLLALGSQRLRPWFCFLSAPLPLPKPVSTNDVYFHTLTLTSILGWGPPPSIEQRALCQLQVLVCTVLLPRLCSSPSLPFWILHIFLKPHRCPTFFRTSVPLSVINADFSLLFIFCFHRLLWSIRKKQIMYSQIPILNQKSSSKLFNQDREDPC